MEGFPVLCFTQLLGVALGAGLEEMEIDRGLIPLGEELCALAGA
jgi:heterodisulfide reductase subunit B